MHAKRASLLNQVMHDLPEGFVVDAAWLKSVGLSASSVRDYVDRGWLERAGSRLYRKPGRLGDPAVRWEYAFLSLQSLLAVPSHVGGMTALELAGYWQYAPMGRRTVWLYSDAPLVRSYLRRLELDADVALRSRKLFTENELGVETRALDLVTSTISPASANNDNPPVAHKHQLRISSLERAILEVLADVPRTFSFTHGEELFDGLTTLRPKLVEALLRSCTSVKAKRLFLYFAGQQKQGWARRLDTTGIDLGSGKRQVVPGGEFDSRFQITVPRTRSPGRSARSGQ
jgi:hypothetical protein